MSADNFIGVFARKDSLGRDVSWHVAHGMMPSIENPDRQWAWEQKVIAENKPYPTREAAILAAFDMVKQEERNGMYVEYGVMEI